MASHHMTASVVASTQPQTQVQIASAAAAAAAAAAAGAVAADYSHFHNQPVPNDNNNYYEHQLSAMHSYPTGGNTIHGHQGPVMQHQVASTASNQQPQTHGGGSSPSSGGQRTSPVTSSVGQSAHGN